MRIVPVSSCVPTAVTSKCSSPSGCAETQWISQRQMLQTAQAGRVGETERAILSKLVLIADVQVQNLRVACFCAGSLESYLNQKNIA